MKHKTKIFYTAFLIVLAFVAVGQPFGAHAQDGHNRGTMTAPKTVANPKFSIERIPSLFFTYWQFKAILEAQKSRGVVRPPTQAELDALDRGDDFEPDPGPRDITLGGILYTKKNEWVIWINGQRVTPDAVPKEVLDLQVFEDYIEIKWLDEYTKQIFPLRLRAHQRFNLDARVFLPG